MKTAETMAGKTVKVTRSLTASPERIFDAWLNPEIARRFLFATPTGEMVRVDIDAHVGGRFLIVRRTDGDDVEHVGEYLAIERPRRLVFTFAVPKYSPVYTQVSIDIVPEGSGSKLTLTHEGVLPEWADRTQEGWEMILGSLDRTVSEPVNSIDRPYAELTAPDTISIQRILPGPLERAWSYLIDSDKRGLWLATGEIKPELGAPFTLFFRHTDLTSVNEPIPARYASLKDGHLSHARLTQYNPPHTLAFLWGESKASQQEVTIRLTPRGNEVLLQLTHRRLSGSGRMSNFAAAWHMHLGILADRLDGREPGGVWSAMDKYEPEYARRFGD